MQTLCAPCHRTYQSYANDLAQLADYLGVRRFFMAGASGGGPYVFAASYYLPERVRGAMTISTLAPPGEATRDPYMAGVTPPGATLLLIKGISSILVQGFRIFWPSSFSYQGVRYESF